MKSWFETFAKKEFEYEYEYIYDFKYTKKLQPQKNTYLNIDDGFISGSVEHKDGKINQIKIKFPQFKKSEIEKINNVLEHPTNQFALSHKTVPSEVFGLGIEIYPKSLDDLNIKYKFNDEKLNKIDALSILNILNKKLIKNEFLIFKLKGMEIKKPIIKYNVKTIDEIFKNKFKSKSENKTLKNLYDINVTLLRDLSNAQNYEVIYSDLFKSLIDEISSLPTKANSNKGYINFDTLKINDEIKKPDEKQKYFYKKWDKYIPISINLDKNYNIEGKLNERNLFSMLLESNQITLKNPDEHLVFLRKLLDLAFTLILHNAMMPEFFLAPKTRHIRWIPSFFSEEVFNYCSTYYPQCPNDLITFKGEKLTKENQTIIALGLITTGYIQYICEKNSISSLDRYFSSLCFRLMTGEALNLKETKTNQTMTKKFAPFYLKTLDFKYALFINDDFEVEIKIKNGDEYKSLNQATLQELLYVNIIYDLFNKNKLENIIYEKIPLTKKGYIIFNREIRENLECIGVEINTSFKTQKTDLKVELDTYLDESNFNFKNINDVVWNIKLGEYKIGLNDFTKLIDPEAELLLLNNICYIFNWPEFRKVLSHSYELLHAKDNKLLKLALLKKWGDFEFEVNDKFKRLINASDIYEVPTGLTGELRPYQKIGFSWIVQNIKSGFGSILADDMGLGKTLQVLTAILHLKEEHISDDETALIIVPTTLISNWENEINKFTPELTYYIYYGSNRRFPLEHYDIILTSYGIIRNDLDMFLDKKWFLCVIDEAQNIKNPSTQQTYAIKSINAFNHIALTGTPIENKLLDYWSIFEFINKGYLSTRENFKDNYIIPIERFEDEKVLKNLKSIAKPFVLRRLKSDEEIRKELPEKFVNDIYCRLTKMQIKLYEAILDDEFTNIEHSKGIQRRAMILKTINYLKQICNHPAQFLGSENPKVKDSGKMDLLINTLENIFEMDEKTIIFTQYAKMGKIIQEIISKKMKCDVEFLHGQLSLKERERLIDTFQSDDNCKVLVATIKTGGIGLNLTAASNVIHYDLWWNPAVENQATDRVHRIGQEKNVMVYRFITKGTLEEGIDAIVKSKLDLAEKAISTDETFITEMTNEDLRKMLSLRL